MTDVAPCRLLEPFLVRAENERHVREPRHVGADRLIQEDLLRRVGDVIVAAHHVRDLHLHIVRDDGELVRRMTVGADDDEVFDVGAVEFDRTVDEIVEARRARRHLEADRARLSGALARGDVVRGACETRAVVRPAARGGFAGGAFRGQFFSGAVAVVRASLRDEGVRHRAMPIAPLRLKVRPVRPADLRPFVPVQTKPAQPVEDAVHHFVRRALGVGVFDAQHEDAAEAPREQPVEQRRARAADVQVARGRGSEPNAGSWHLGL